jgi:hypothetical protein
VDVETRGIRDPAPDGGSAKADAVLVHGTWSHSKDWWRPGSSFHSYLRDNAILPNLYSGSNPFGWAGTIRRLSRDDAAGALAWWSHNYLSSPPKYIAHSHGGTLAMTMTHLKKPVERLVLLACPVTETRPNHTDCPRVDSIRAPYDFVLWAGGYATRFPSDYGITEYVLQTVGPSLDVLRVHGAPRDPAVWQRERIGERLRLT